MAAATLPALEPLCSPSAASRSSVAHPLSTDGHVRRRRPTVTAMKKLLVLIVVVALAAFAVKKLQDA
jgi:hypothetical protein